MPITSEMKDTKNRFNRIAGEDLMVTGRKIRVMMLLSNGDVGGGQTTVQLLVRGLDPERFDISIVCPDSQTLTSLADVPGLKRIPFNFSSFPRAGEIRRLARLFRQEQPDLVHTYLFLADLYGFLATRIAPVNRLLSTVQGINFFWEIERFPRKAKIWLFSKCYRAIYRAFDGIATCSDAVKQALFVRPGMCVQPEKVRVICNSIDVRRIQARAEHRLITDPPAHQNGNGPKRIISVGNLYPIKGHRYLLEAVARIKNDTPLKCLVVGDGPERPALQRKAAELGLEGTVEFLGLREDIPSLLNHADLFAFPSLWDGMGIAVLEAMALGVPVIAFEAGGVPEMVRDGETGLLVPAGNVSALSEGIRRLLRDRPFAQAMAAKARETLASHFDAAEMVRAYEDWYRYHLEGRMRP